MLTKTLAALTAATALAACVAPTSYRESGAGGNNFGYASSKLSDQLYRVRFTGSSRTPLRWSDAFVLYRAAQIAKEAGAPAFKIVEGTVDTTVLTGDEVFGQMNPLADVEVSQMQTAQRSQSDGDRVIEPYMQRTAGTMPVFRAPPAPMTVRSQAPLFIYIPSGGPGPAQPVRSILIELRSDLKDMDEKTFATDDVLRRLEPRIKRAGQPIAARDTASPPFATWIPSATGLQVKGASHCGKPTHGVPGRSGVVIDIVSLHSSYAGTAPMARAIGITVVT